uniref:C2H2-type domain-containing protein n=1 Tax=viral metagenome TaxID=1070528 RepID=A0A6C0JER0_9ZZZZ
METQKTPKNTEKYHCKLCDFSTCHLGMWKRHLETKKHTGNKWKRKKHQKTPLLFCSICGKSYKSRSGLYKHMKRCEETLIEAEEKDYEDVDNKEIKEMREKINELESKIKKETQIVTKADDKAFMTTCMQTMMTMMKKMEQQDELFAKQQEQLSEMIPKLGNNNNNRININVFLNEQCKDAINMSEFLEGIKIQLEDLDYVKNNGLSNGISQVFVNELKQLDTFKRPIHCTDIKRETLYIKDNDDWSKEEPRERLRKSFKDVAHSYRKAIAEWESLHPGWVTSEKGRDEYLSLVQNTYQDIYAKNENRIIKNIAKETIIDKDKIKN